MNPLSVFLYVMGIGTLICKCRGEHRYGPDENRWPELGKDGVINQCQLCGEIRTAPQKEKQ